MSWIPLGRDASHNLNNAAVVPVVSRVHIHTMHPASEESTPEAEGSGTMTGLRLN